MGSTMVSHPPIPFNQSSPVQLHPNSKPCVRMDFADGFRQLPPFRNSARWFHERTAPASGGSRHLLTHIHLASTLLPSSASGMMCRTEFQHVQGSWVPFPNGGRSWVPLSHPRPLDEPENHSLGTARASVCVCVPPLTGTPLDFTSTSTELTATTAAGPKHGKCHFAEIAFSAFFRMILHMYSSNLTCISNSLIRFA